MGNNLVLGFYRMSEWIMRLAIINFLWLLFILVGGLVFGMGPSTAAMFAVIRKWIMGKTDIPIFRTFWKYYRREFVKANVLMFCLLIIGWILFIDLRYFQIQEDFIFRILSSFTLGLIVIFVIIIMYIFPVFVHYNLNIFQYIRHAFMIGIARPLLTILMGMICFFVYYLMKSIPGLIPFFGASSISVTLMWVSYQSFLKVATTNKNVIQGGG